jgi:hypothetical protein
MPEEKKESAKPAPVAVAKASLAKMSEGEQWEIYQLIRHTVEEHNLPKFQAGLLKLGFDENSHAYSQLMQLWDEFHRASRHG